MLYTIIQLLSVSKNYKNTWSIHNKSDDAVRLQMTGPLLLQEFTTRS